jgi:hypothetical protein
VHRSPANSDVDEHGPHDTEHGPAREAAE